MPSALAQEVRQVTASRLLHHLTWNTLLLLAVEAEQVELALVELVVAVLVVIELHQDLLFLLALQLQ
jgi:hypothetical protein